MNKIEFLKEKQSILKSMEDTICITRDEAGIICDVLEKQIPKKPLTHQNTNRADCPVCGATVRGIREPFGDWCSKCGQALDWNG